MICLILMPFLNINIIIKYIYFSWSVIHTYSLWLLLLLLLPYLIIMLPHIYTRTIYSNNRVVRTHGTWVYNCLIWCLPLATTWLPLWLLFVMTVHNNNFIALHNNIIKTIKNNIIIIIHDDNNNKNNNYITHCDCGGNNYNKFKNVIIMIITIIICESITIISL